MSSADSVLPDEGSADIAVEYSMVTVTAGPPPPPG
jgi:hypothetical protein